MRTNKGATVADSTNHANHVNRTLTYYRENPHTIKSDGGRSRIVGKLRGRIASPVDPDELAIWEHAHPVERLTVVGSKWDWDAAIRAFEAGPQAPQASRAGSRLPGQPRPRREKPGPATGLTGFKP